MYSRGQFALIGKVGRKALRLYEQEGLLIPREINPQNGYHYYGEEQLEQLYKIKTYRKYGLSLAEISGILLGKEQEKEVLVRRIKDVYCEIETDIAIKDQMEKYLAKPFEEENKSEGAMFIQVEIKNFCEGKVLVRKERVDLEKLGMSVGKLYEEAAQKHMTVSGSHYVRYDDIFEENGEFQMQTCLPVFETCEMIHDRRAESHECLHAVYKGGFSSIGKVHLAILEYAQTNGIRLGETVFEVYNKDMSAEVYHCIERS